MERGRDGVDCPPNPWLSGDAAAGEAAATATREEWALPPAFGPKKERMDAAPQRRGVAGMSADETVYTRRVGGQGGGREASSVSTSCAWKPLCIHACLFAVPVSLLLSFSLALLRHRHMRYTSQTLVSGVSRRHTYCDDVTYVYDDVTYVCDDVTYVYE